MFANRRAFNFSLCNSLRPPSSHSLFQIEFACGLLLPVQKVFVDFEQTVYELLRVGRVFERAHTLVQHF
jgi:hypothetical protein